MKGKPAYGLTASHVIMIALAGGIDVALIASIIARLVACVIQYASDRCHNDLIRCASICVPCIRYGSGPCLLR